ncbi:MAG: PrsW family intramembrane metalloprotease [Actinomycetota bacterium]
MASDAKSLQPRWGYRTTLFQFRKPAFWLFVLVMVVGALVTFAEQSFFRQMSPSGWGLSWLLVLVYAAPVFMVVYLLDLFEREPISLVVAALLWGAVAATALAGLANQGWGLVVARIGGPDFASRWTAALTAPWVEEILKVLGVVLIALIARDEIDDVMDGFVYGALCGLGFAVVEDVFYFMAVFGGEPAGVLTGFFVRVIASGLYGHLLYSGIAGIGVAYFVARKGQATLLKRLLVAGGLFLFAMLAHFIWNSPWLDFFPDMPWTGSDWLVIPLATAVKGVPFLILVCVMVVLARRRERRWFRMAVDSELGGDGLLKDEFDVVQYPRRRRRARREMRARAGPRAAALLKRLQREQVNLAMIRTRVHRDDHPDLMRQRLYCKSLRDALVAMPGAPSAADGS